jgi:protein SCO1/2
VKRAAIFLCMLAAQAAPGVELRSGSFSPPRAAPDFSLHASDGSDVRVSQYRGKVVALGFGYTNCPDVCPTILSHLARARKSLGGAGRDLQVLYVTVDPARDTVERMREFMSAFDPTFLGVTGSAADLEKARKAYGVQVSRQKVAGDPGSYYVHHSSSVFLIDRGGSLRAMIPYGTAVDDVSHDVRALLEEKP